MDYSKYPAKWQERFEFFDKYGAPGTYEYTQAYKLLPFKQKMKIGVNWIAFFFGFIYLFVLGLWKKNLSLFGISIVLSIVISLFLPESAARGVNIAFGIIYAYIANYAYYLKEVKGMNDSWNPFEGIPFMPQKKQAE